MTEQDVIRARFFSLQSRKDVAALIGVSDRSLRYFLYSRRTENLYNSFSIPKGNGRERQIDAPVGRFKSIQKKMALILNNVYEPKICAYGFISKRSIVDNANKHAKKRTILNIDLKDFFQQIHFGRIRGMLLKPPYSIGDEAATTIAQISCYKGRLPQGAPTSPVISNMICAPLDNALMRFAKKYQCTYSRYADDITFSTSRGIFDKAVVSSDNGEIVLGEELLSLFEKHSFRINHDKVVLMNQNRHQEVTGLTVNRFVNLRRGYLKQLRAILHHCEVDGVIPAAKDYIIKVKHGNQSLTERLLTQGKEDELIEWFRLVIQGKIDYIRQVRGRDSSTYQSFWKTYCTLFGLQDYSDYHEHEIIFVHLNKLAENTVFIIESNQEMAEDCAQGTCFLLKDYGLMTCAHVVEEKYGEFYNIYEWRNYSSVVRDKVYTKLKGVILNPEIDYALLIPRSEYDNELVIGDSTNLKSGDTVFLLGYPNYTSNSTPSIIQCKITHKKTIKGVPLYCVDKSIAHGASGGPVLNQNYEVVGIIKTGSECGSDTGFDNGFLPIHVVVNDIDVKKGENELNEKED